MAALLVAAGVGLFVWTIAAVGWRRACGLTDEPRHAEDPRLVLGGPFAIVRRPVGLAAILVVSGLAVAAGSGIALFAGMLAITAVGIAAARSDAVLVARHGEAYRRYRKAVPLLLPRFRSGS